MSNCENGMKLSEVTLHLMTCNKRNYCGYFARQIIGCISATNFQKKSKRHIHQSQSEDRHVEFLQTSWHHVLPQSPGSTLMEGPRSLEGIKMSSLQDLNVRSRWFRCFSPTTTGILSPRILSSAVSLFQQYCGSFLSLTCRKTCCSLLSLTCRKTGCSLLSLTCRKTCCRSWTFSFLLEPNCLRPP